MRGVTGKKGFTLFLCILTSTIAGMVIAGYMWIAGTDARAVGDTTDGIRAYYIAEAGAAAMFAQMSQTAGHAPNTTAMNNVPFDVGGGRQGTYTVTASSISPIKYTIVSTGSFPIPGAHIRSVSRTIRVTVAPMYASSWAFLFGHEKASISSQPLDWITGDITDGPYHSNEQIHVKGNPQFSGRVESFSHVPVKYDIEPTELVFLAGPPAGDAELIYFDPIVPLDIIADNATSQYTYQGNDTRIVFTGQTMTVRNSAMYGDSNDHPGIPLPSQGAIYVAGNVSVSGTVGGNLTLGSAKNISITGNLQYTDDVVNNTSSTNMLGLVAKYGVNIPASAPSNITVQAYIVALGTNFSATYNNTNKGNLNFLGGIQQNFRGTVGSPDRSKGYTMNFHYDKRMPGLTPLHFPILTDYNHFEIWRIVSWSSDPQVVNEAI